MNDTSPESAEKMREMIRMKSPIERLKMGCLMNDASRRLVYRAIMENNPDISQNGLRQELFLRFYGSDFDPIQREKIIQHLAQFSNESVQCEERMTQTNDTLCPTGSRKRASFKSILAAESLVQNQTYDTYGPWFVRFGQSIDVLLGLCYLECDLPQDTESDEYRFVIHALDVYYELPLSFRGCSVLMEKGLYSDALNCCRSILESLVKHKYLLDHKDQIEAYETGGKDSKGQKVTIRRAWEYVAGPDSQEKAYRLPSKLAHKNFGSSLPRLNALLNSQTSFSFIPVFNKILAETVIPHLMFLLLGYMNLSKSFFSYKYHLAEPGFLENYNDIRGWLDDQIKKNKVKFPQIAPWCEVMEKIVY